MTGGPESVQYEWEAGRTNLTSDCARYVNIPDVPLEQGIFR